MAASMGAPGIIPASPHSETGGPDLRARLRNVARVLHDDIGPSLCAAGLHLDLLSRAEPAPAQTEPIEALRTALEHAVESVRRLSYEAAPDLALRHGLDRACRLLAGSRPWLEISGAASRVLPPASAQALYELLLDLLLAAGACPAAHLVLAEDGWSLLLPAPFPESGSWARRAAAHGLSCVFEPHPGGGVRISAAAPGGMQEESGCPTF
jgi:hypothetical protein